MAAILMLTLIAANSVAWFIERRVTELMLADLLARASDQVELGLLPRVTSADFEPPYTQAKLDMLETRLDSILDRARESGSGVIRVDLLARDGTVLYSDLASLQGQVVSPLANPLLAGALAGSASAEITSLTHQEDADLLVRYGSAMKAYVPCILDGRVAGAYELYTEPGPLWPMRWAIWASLGVGFTLVLCGIVMLTRGTGGSPVSAKTGGVISSIRPPLVIRTGLVRLDAAGESAVEGGSPPGADAGIHALVNSASECWLSRRETEVLRLLATDRTYREIAGELSVSEETVRSHVKSILHKLGQPDRTRAVAAAVRAGMLR
jgi:DNA-binding CsgD family transcriptional regulator